jgi:predicted nucleic acid-binding protein
MSEGVRGASSYRRKSSQKLLPTHPSSTTTNFAATSMLSPIPARETGTHGRRALIDTSVAVRLNETELPQLPLELAISTLTMAELARGPHVARKELEKARRRRHLRRVEAGIEALPFDFSCAGAYGCVSAAVERIGRKPRGSRVVDLLIAATALAHDLPLYTLNPKDLRGLEHLIEIVDVGA